MTHQHPTGSRPAPLVVAWELTRRCPLSCRHCRASARAYADEKELSTEECLRVVDSLSSRDVKPLLILTGGEPLCRADVWTIAKRASDGGLRVVMAPCGASVNEASVRRMRESGIKAISLSVDGATKEKHDAFRGVPGAFDANFNAMACARAAELPFQINALVSRETVDDLPTIHAMALREGASRLDLFFLVPVGRGAALKHLALSPEACEQALEWAVRMNDCGPLPIKTTCAPQAVRISHRHKNPAAETRRSPLSSGCLAGRGFIFISHVGVLQPCGFCDVAAGDLRQFGFDFEATCSASPVFQRLKETSQYGGKCGICEFRTVCGGCRARALAATGDYMAEEPACPHQPVKRAS